MYDTTAVNPLSLRPFFFLSVRSFHVLFKVTEDEEMLQHCFLSRVSHIYCLLAVRSEDCLEHGVVKDHSTGDEPAPLCSATPSRVARPPKGKRQHSDCRSA